jgi:hypothetical protein
MVSRETILLIRLSNIAWPAQDLQVILIVLATVREGNLVVEMKRPQDAAPAQGAQTILIGNQSIHNQGAYASINTTQPGAPICSLRLGDAITMFAGFPILSSFFLLDLLAHAVIKPALIGDRI